MAPDSTYGIKQMQARQNAAEENFKWDSLQLLAGVGPAINVSAVFQYE